MSAHMQQAFVDLLDILDAGLTSAGSRIYAHRLPQAPTYPCACYNVVSSSITQTHSGPVDIETLRVQFDLFSTGVRTLMILRDELIDTLHALTQTTQGSTLFGYAHLDLERDDYDGGPIEIHRKTLDFEISYQPTS